jgi:hypothetical protein
VIGWEFNQQSNRNRKRLGEVGRRLFLTVLCLTLITSFVKGQESPPNQDYFVEAVVDNAAPYVGQQITYRVRFFDAVGISNPLYEAPSFEGFWRIDRQTINRTVVQLNNRQYTVTELDTTLYPTRTGVLSIAPAKVVLPESVFNAQAEMSATPINVDVQPLPEGAPDGFIGAVGQFDLSATLDRQSAQSGEPFLLHLTVAGTGNVEQLTLPEFPDTGGWRIYPNPTTFSVQEANGLIVGEKVYEYVLIPEQAGTLALPSFTLHYFDPVNLQYRSISTQPINLEVLPADEITIAPTLTAPAASQDIASLLLKPISLSGQENSTATPGVIFWLVWLLPPLVVGGCWWWMRRQEKQRLEQFALRRSAALTRAKGQLQKLSKSANERNYQLLREIIINYFRDKLGRRLVNVVDSDLQRLLDQFNVPPDLSKKVMLCLEWTDEGQYAPTQAVNFQTLMNRASETLTAVENVWNAK